MTIKIPTKLLLLIPVGMLFISSCGGNSASTSESESKLFTEAEEKIFKDISKIIEDLPPPAVVPTTMQELGAKYDESITNNLERLDDYLVEPHTAALNLGIYAADIGYLIAYDQVQESVDHMTACQKIAENLGVATAFDLQLMQQFENAMDDHERLIELLNETIIKAEKRLGDSDQLENAGLVLTGSFIEGLYLAVTVIDNYHKTHRGAEADKLLEPLVKLVLEQEQPLIDIIKLLKDIPPNQNLNSIIAELNILKLLYDGDLAEIEKQLAENPDLVITEEMLFDINLEVTRIRSDIIQ
jgi:tetratricopeptide (TPR) repeat protein